MSTASLVTDGLWQCLCPSFTRPLLNPRRRPVLQCVRQTSVLQCVRQIPVLQCIRQTPVVQCIQTGRTTKRTFSSTTQTRAAYHPLSPDPKPDTPTLSRFTSFDNQFEKVPRNARRDARELEEKEERDATRLAKMHAAEHVTLPLESTTALYARARVLAATGEWRKALYLVDRLVKVRGEKPNARLYGIIILANINAASGAAWRVADTLGEMFDEGIEPDVGVCHDVLKVLSVHIDYLLRADLLEYMRQKWMTLTENGHHDVVAALLREGQLEIAVTRLAEMREAGYLIQPWLSDLAIYLLSESGEHAEALRLLKERIAAGDSQVSRGVWLNLLDNASAVYNHDVTSFCWKNQVNAEFINPSSGLCLNVLSTAARAGDARLATDVFHVLSKRATIFTHLHYELLLTTYLSGPDPDLRAALTVLTIMVTAKIEPTIISTRPIYQYIVQDPSRCIQAFDILVSLLENARRVPAAALNVIIEAHVNHRDLEKAIIVYKAMHTFDPAIAFPTGNPNDLSGQKPFANVETFNLLLRGTYRDSAGPDHKTALFLASEMLAMAIQPNVLTYDRLIIVSLRADVIDHAVRYLDEMTDLGFVPRLPTIVALCKRLARRGDSRCWDVVEKVVGLEPGVLAHKRDLEYLWGVAREKKRLGKGDGGGGVVAEEEEENRD